MNQTIATTIATLGTLAVIAGGSYASDHIAVPYDWQIELQTRKLSAAEADFSMRGGEKVVATYEHAPTDAAPDPVKHAYESFLYDDGKEVAFDRKRGLAVDDGDAIAIVVEHEDGYVSNRECKATANAILHVVRDCHLHSNSLVSVRLPSDSFSRISSALIRLGCRESAASSTAIAIRLETESRAMTLYCN